MDATRLLPPAVCHMMAVTDLIADSGEGPAAGVKGAPFSPRTGHVRTDAHMRHKYASVLLLKSYFASLQESAVSTSLQYTHLTALHYSTLCQIPRTPAHLNDN